MTRLRSDEALNYFNTALDEKLGPVDVESPVIETAWNSLQEAINVACKERMIFVEPVEHTHTLVDGTSMNGECVAVDAVGLMPKLQPRVDHQVCAVRFLT